MQGIQAKKFEKKSVRFTALVDAVFIGVGVGGAPFHVHKGRVCDSHSLPDPLPCTQKQGAVFPPALVKLIPLLDALHDFHDFLRPDTFRFRQVPAVQIPADQSRVRKARKGRQNVFVVIYDAVLNRVIRCAPAIAVSAQTAALLRDRHSVFLSAGFSRPARLVGHCRGSIVVCQKLRCYPLQTDQITAFLLCPYSLSAMGAKAHNWLFYKW